MAKVIKADLSSSSISSMITSLQNDINDTNTLIQELSKFAYNSSNSLKGESYNVARANAAAYIPILEKRKAIASSLQQAISSAKNRMIGFMENYDLLDDSKLEEIIAQFNQASINLEQAREDYEALENPTQNQNAYLSSYLSTYQTVKKLKDKLEQLSGADANAYSSLQSVSDDISSYSSSISSVKESNITINL